MNNKIFEYCTGDEFKEDVTSQIGGELEIDYKKHHALVLSHLNKVQSITDFKMIVSIIPHDKNLKKIYILHYNFGDRDILNLTLLDKKIFNKNELMAIIRKKKIENILKSI